MSHMDSLGRGRRKDNDGVDNVGFVFLLIGFPCPRRGHVTIMFCQVG